MTLLSKLSTFIARRISPDLAAKALSHHAAEKRARERLTLAEKQERLHAELRAYVNARKPAEGRA